MDAQVKSTRTITEFKDCLNSLREADLVRIRKAASLFATRTQGFMSADDLIQEAIKRTLSGNRKWSSDISLIVHITGTIKSIASHVRSLPGETVPADTVEKDDTVFYDESIEGVRRLEDALATDKQALDVLEYIAEGYGSKTICGDLEIEKTTYETIMKRIRRTGEKLGLREGRRMRGIS